MDFSKDTLNRYTGDRVQLYYAKQYRFEGGRSDGMRGVDIDNGAGIVFTVLPDRAMDIGRFSYKGVNYSHISKAGYVSPKFYDDKNMGWLKTFSAGFLTTCGLTQVGSPCEDDGEALGLHGRISAVPAEDFSVFVDHNQDTPEIVLKGCMRLAKLFDNNLWLKREIKITVGDNKVYVADQVENRGGAACPYMVLYHFNIGYPLRDEAAQFGTNAKFIRPRDEVAQAGVGERLKFAKPKTGYREQVFYYEQKKDDNGKSFAGLYNSCLERGVKIWTRPEELKNLIQWKNAGYGDYVMGIEPSNCFVEGRVKQKEYGLEYIGQGETKTQRIIIETV